MSLFSKLFDRGADPLDAQAEALVNACSILAIGSFVPLIDQFAFLRTCNTKDWDFLATAAAVHVALNNLATEVVPERFSRLNSMVTAKLDDWDKQGLAAVRDCHQFVKRAITKSADDAQHVAYALGLWVLWNLLRRQPTFEESHAASAIGTLLASPLHDWWHPKKH